MATASGQARFKEEDEKPERKRKPELKAEVAKAEPPKTKAVARKAEPEEKKVAEATPKKAGIEEKKTVGEVVDYFVDLALRKGRASSLDPKALAQEALRHHEKVVPPEKTLVRVNVEPKAAAAAVHLGEVLSEAAAAFLAIENGERKETKGQLVREMRWG